ncbi:hypothetical protein GQ457_13G005800 [Hibiscus cannabinus]
MGFCGYFPCFGSSNKEESNSGGSVGLSHHINGDSLDRSKPQVSENGSKENHAAQIFTFQELAAATENFRPECLLGEGGFGRVLVYKGCFERTGQVVAVKRLDGNGLQGNRDFLAELLILNLLHHPNLVNLIGYCADGDRRLLVFEFMPLGSLEDRLHDLPPGKEPLDWNTRTKIAAGVAKLITGRRAVDNMRAPGEQDLVAWARPFFKDRRKFTELADPLLQGHYPMQGLYQALDVAAMCLHEQAATRPLIGDVATSLTHLASQMYDPNAPNICDPNAPN